MRYTFLNREKGLYILKKLLKKKYFFLVKAVFCRKSIKQLQNLILAHGLGIQITIKTVKFDYIIL